MSKDTGGPAYPQNTVYMAPNGQVQQQGPQGGMTLRDYFAAKAMQGDLVQGIHQMDFRITAERAYLMADEMMKARK